MSDENKSGLRDAIRTYLEDIMSFYAERTKRKIKSYAVSVVVAIASLTVMIYGTGSIIGSFFPEWRAGISHMLAGALSILIALAYKKYYG